MRRAPVTVIVVLVVAAGAWASDQPPTLSYAIEDQFGETHTQEECAGAVALLLGGGREGSEYISDWGPALHRALADELENNRVCSVGFAHLKGVPFFVKKKVVDGFSKDPDQWTLLDWKGSIAKRWGAEKDAANIYLFDRDGRIVLRESLTEFDQVQLDRLVKETLETVSNDS